MIFRLLLWQNVRNLFEAIKISLPFISPRIKLKKMSYCLEVDCFQAEISTSLSSFGNPTPVFRLQIKPRRLKSFSFEIVVDYLPLLLDPCVWE